MLNVRPQANAVTAATGGARPTAQLRFAAGDAPKIRGVTSVIAIEEYMYIIILT